MSNTIKYLWMSNPSSYAQKKNSTIYIYLNEKNDKIHGDIVSNSNKESGVKDAIYCGIANKFVTSFKTLDLSYMHVGLTDINKNEYEILKKSWEIKTI